MVLILNFAMDIRFFRVYLLSSFYIRRGSLGREPRLSFVFQPLATFFLKIIRILEPFLRNSIIINNKTKSK